MGLLESLIAQRQGLKIKAPPIPVHARMCAFVRAYLRACACLSTSLKLVKSWKMFPIYITANGNQRGTY